MNVDKIDLLILPYGEAVPGEALPAIREFIEKGGGIFTTGGRPFGSILRKNGKIWEKDDSFDVAKYLSNLGIGSYIIYSKDIASIRPTADIFITEYPMTSRAPLQYGLCVKTSEKIYNKPPARGNVFPFRIPARDYVRPVIFLDENNVCLGSPVILIKSWSNPYMATERIPDKWCLIGVSGADHPLDPKDENSTGRLREIIRFLSTRVILTGVETDYSSYREGESVKVTAGVLNYGSEKEEADLSFFIKEGNSILFKEEKKVLIGPQERKILTVTWKPETLDTDFYEIKAVLEMDGKVIDEGGNAFTVWHDSELKNGVGLTVRDRYFYQGDKRLYLCGVNYYESRLGELMWVNPNVLDIENDLREMSGFGVNLVRVHYHPPKWFRDYLETNELPVSEYFKNLGKTYLPDERSLRILDSFIILCHKYGMYFQPDIFTLVPEEMGNSEGWIGDTERCRDTKKIEKQKEFVRLLAGRYRGTPGIMWDLWNEPFLGRENTGILREWVREIRDCFRHNGDTHLVTLGSDESIELEKELDFLCGHGHEVKVPESDKPFIMQEVWNESDLSPEKEKAQAEKLKRDFTACMEQGGAGFAPWQWTRQSRLWDDASDAERWDDELGLCVREDGSLKPAGKVYRELIEGKTR